MDDQLRISPKTIKQAEQMAATHVARYTIALESIKSGVVCDVACGVGYGSHLLSQRADKVYGIDIDQEAIDWAETYFQNERTDFHCSNVDEKWPVDTMFDAIISYETIEHLRNPEQFVREISKRLKPGGKLFLSLPNGPRDKDRHSDNQYHIHHFTAEQITSMIKKYFSNAEFFSLCYRRNIKHYAHKFFVSLFLKRIDKHLVANYYLKPGLDSREKTWFVTSVKFE